MQPPMERSKHLALMFLLGAVLVGGVLGFTADRVIVRDRLAPGRWWSTGAMRSLLAEDLALSAAQRAQLDTILDEKHERMAEVLKPVRARMDSVDDASRAKLRAMLTDDQRRRFDEMRQGQQRQSGQGGPAADTGGKR